MKALAVSTKAASRASCYAKAVKFVGYLFGAQGAVVFKSPWIQGATWESLVKGLS